MARRPDWWLKKWNATVGGSRAPKLIGASKFGGPASEFDFATGAKPMPDLENNPDVRRGVKLEPIARDLLKEVGYSVQNHHQFQFLTNDKYPWAHALPDGWALGDQDLEAYPIEIKWPRPAKVEQIRLEGLSPDYMAQAQHNMAVTGKKKLYFAVCSCVTLDVILVPVEFDEAFAASMMEVERNWMEHVRAGQRPAEIVADSPIIEVPSTEGEMKILTSALSISAARAYLEAKQLADDAEELLQASRDRLFDLTEGAICCEVREDGETPLARLHRIAVSGARKFDAARCVAENPEMAKYYTVGKAYEQKRVYPMQRNEGGFI